MLEFNLLPVKVGYVSNLSIHAVAVEILRNREPLTAKEIAKEIAKVRKFEGATPARTVSAILNRSIHVKYVGNRRYTIEPNASQ